jgi:hypothetical protein
MSSSQEDVKPMIVTYKKLFITLSVITLVGIGLVLAHIPLWIILTVGLAFILLKSFIVFEAFKKLMLGRNAIIILFGLTIFFLAHLLLLPVLTHQGSIVGTEDTSKQLMMDEPAVPAHGEGHHGN